MVRLGGGGGKKIKKWLELELYHYCSGGFMFEKVEQEFEVQRIGSYSNVIGLPLERLKEYCNQYNISTFEVDVTDSELIKNFM